MHIHRAALLLDNAERTLRSARPELMRITPAGDFCRGCELIGDLSLVAQALLLEKGKVALGGNGTLTHHLTDVAHYGAALLFATGPRSHLDALQARARARRLTLSPDGLKRGRTIVAAKTESEIYRALDLSFIPPELREGRDEIARAVGGELPRLVENKDLRGILHAHTDLSDGLDTLEAMADAARQRGYRYFGVADHSKSAHYAGGQSLEEIAEQHHAIDRLNKSFGREFQIFKGIESDILADGAHDYPEAVLEGFDFVVASVHTRFKMNRKAQMDRIVRAVANPHTTILGHITGRRLLRRPGYEIEIRGGPSRLRRAWRRGRDQSQSLAPRSGLALPPGRPRSRLHDEHQPRCAFDPRAGLDALGDRNGTQGGRAGRPRAQCFHSAANRAAFRKRRRFASRAAQGARRCNALPSFASVVPPAVSRRRGSPA
jgi:DNA polymerase (family X)